MSVGNDGAQLVQGVVEVVHPSALAGVDVQAHALALSSGFGFADSAATGSGRRSGRIFVNFYSFMLKWLVRFMIGVIVADKNPNQIL